ncbi:MAG: N-(5'-phosphoribosyl)anthranilate isomerase [Planctomycetota bacterium]|nr:MAG: N-(5'-phosphoribosyl)anthranilate isomerase [Planctomycetota bacterium]
MTIKICGITTPDDAATVLAAGADWFGLNLVAGPRRIPLDIAGRILVETGRCETAVALVAADALSDPERCPAALAALGLRRLQIYGHPSRSALDELSAAGLSWIAVHHLAPAPSQFRASLDRSAAIAALADAAKRSRDDGAEFLLLDTASPLLGGSGRRSDWSMLVDARDRGLLQGAPPILLAGGLTPANVAEAVRECRPAGVDVSSGVEIAPGRKDVEQVRAFVTAARAGSAPPGRGSPQ